MSDFFCGKKILIAGGLGFIGSNLTRRLVQLGAHVQIVDSLVAEGGGNLSNVSGIENQIDIHIQDVRREPEILKLVTGKDYLFNLIGQTSHSESMKDPHTDLELNCQAQLSLLEACRKANTPPKVIFTSTRQIYGKSQTLPAGEEHPVSPIDINGVHKLAAEWYHKIYGQVYGLSICILRLTNTYGPYMQIHHSRQTFLGQWIREMLNGNEFQVFGDGSQLRDFNFVGDVVNALLLAAKCPESDQEIFNLGSEVPIALKDLAKLLTHLNGSGAFEFVPFPENLKAIDIGDYHADISKIRSAFGWQPKTSLEEGLLTTLRFFKSHLKQNQLEQHVDAIL